MALINLHDVVPQIQPEHNKQSPQLPQPGMETPTAEPLFKSSEPNFTHASSSHPDIQSIPKNATHIIAMREIGKILMISIEILF